MQAGPQRRMLPYELDQYLQSKALLHDCDISFRGHDDGCLELKIKDVNAGFNGLPDYKGPVECSIFLQDVSDQESIDETKCFKIYEVQVERESEGPIGGSLLATFWPDGHLRVAFSHAWVYGDE